MIKGEEIEKSNQSQIEEKSEYSGLEAVNTKTIHELNSTWQFWYASRKEQYHHINYGERLKKIAEFNTLEDFFKYYVYLKATPDIERNTDLGLFKTGYQPLWESCPDGGCWFIRFKKNEDPLDIDLLWEKLVFALVGEQFDEPNMLGAVLSIRGRETILEVWFNYFKIEKMKDQIAHKLRNLLSLDDNFTVYFKDNERSLQDKSTLRNCETYSFVSQNAPRKYS